MFFFKQSMLKGSGVSELVKLTTALTFLHAAYEVGVKEVNVKSLLLAEWDLRLVIVGKSFIRTAKHTKCTSLIIS